MKVLSTKVDGEIQQKFLEKIQSEGLDASDVLRRLVNAYVGEPTDPLKPLASAVEVNGRLSEIDGRLREFGEEIDDKINHKVATLETEVKDGFKTELSKYIRSADGCDPLQEFIADYNKKMSAVANFLENHIDVLEKTTGAKRCDDDVKGLSLLRTEYRLQCSPHEHHTIHNH